MKKYSKYAPAALIAGGILLLGASFLFGWTMVNAVQLSAFALIVAGVIVWVWQQKRQSPY